MGAYLCWLGVRLLEMHRVLRGDGSLYLHIDHTAHAYVKTLLDAIFGRENFQNEIIWSYRTGGNSKSTFARKHDTLLFYSKSDQYTFHLPKEKAYTKAKGRRPGIVNLGQGTKEYFEDECGVYSLVNMRDVWSLPYINSQAKERKGYPTQKPLALYKRIIEASSSEGDFVLDPFCGCATTPIAAEKLSRQWLGMDLWDGARKMVFDRLVEEGLAIRGQESEHLLTFGDVYYKTRPPERTDDNDVAGPVLPQIWVRAKEPWQRLSHAAVREHLEAAQADGDLVICGGCGRVLEGEFMQLDHMLPRADGGANDISNRILLCGPCNRRKGAHLTLSGLRSRNKKAGWMQSEERAKFAQLGARTRAEQVRDGQVKTH